MRAVSDTSPVCNLAVIGRLGIIRTQLGTVWVPEAVWNELSRFEHGPGRKAVEEARAEGWLVVRTLADRSLADILASSLDAGEAEAIALATTSKADLLVIDETDGRNAARNLGLRLTGTLGLLLKEKQQGRFPSLGAEMDRLSNEAGFYISPGIRRKMLALAGEA